MRINRDIRSTVFFAALTVAAVVVTTSIGQSVSAAGGEETHAEAPAEAVSAEPAQPIKSICDAQIAKAENPNVEIPSEFNKPYPSLSACRSYEAAGDPDAPGPIQPIAFSHKHHAGEYEIACLYCHTGTDRSKSAGVPSVEVCMGCHAQFSKDFDEFDGIKLLKEKWEKKESIEWQQIHRTHEFVKFRHNRHIKAGVTCQDCHGPVEEMDKVYMVPDPSFGRMPAKKMEMGWCIECHREQGASQDCATCHY
jgi:hypothetical protein